MFYASYGLYAFPTLLPQEEGQGVGQQDGSDAAKTKPLSIIKPRISNILQKESGMLNFCVPVHTGMNLKWIR